MSRRWPTVPPSAIQVGDVAGGEDVAGHGHVAGQVHIACQVELRGGSHHVPGHGQVCLPRPRWRSGRPPRAAPPSRRSSTSGSCPSCGRARTRRTAHSTGGSGRRRPAGLDVPGLFCRPPGSRTSTSSPGVGGQNMPQPLPAHGVRIGSHPVSTSSGCKPDLGRVAGWVVAGDDARLGLRQPRHDPLGLAAGAVQKVLHHKSTESCTLWFFARTSMR